MNTLTPSQRGRLAFGSLTFALLVIAADSTVATGDPSLLYLLAPILCIFATGHVDASEAFVRAGIVTALVVVTSLIANLAHGRPAPDYRNTTSLVYALSGVFALNLVLIVATSAALRRLWPESDHWTK